MILELVVRRSARRRGRKRGDKRKTGIRWGGESLTFQKPKSGNLTKPQVYILETRKQKTSMCGVGEEDDGGRGGREVGGRALSSKGQYKGDLLSSNLGGPAVDRCR